MLVSARFARLLGLYRKPDGSRWGGQDLERATGGVVIRSYVSNLRKGRIGSPGLDKLGAIAGAMDFPPQLWFGEGEEHRAPDAALAAALEDVAAEAQERGYPHTLEDIASGAHSGFAEGVDAVLGMSTDERADLVSALWEDLDALRAAREARRPAGAKGGRP